MASIFKQKYTVAGKNGERIRKQSQSWYIDYKAADGTRKRVKAFKDKQATAQLAAKLEKESELAQAGIVDKYAEHRKRPLAEHLEDFRQSVYNKGATPKHAELVYTRIKTIIDSCKFVMLSDVSASKAQQYLAQRRKEGLGVQTSNHYLRVIKQFFSWLIADGRIGENPLAYLSRLNAKSDIRVKRRALSAEELNRLISKTLSSGMNNNLSGKERAMLYILAVNTGLRSREISSLTWQSFDFDDEAPAITVKAAYSKHRKEDVLPLRQDVAALFKDWKEERNEPDNIPVFNSHGRLKWARMLGRDLKVADIAPKDDAGRAVDFHALRHTYITNLIKGGASPKVAQALARHSNITLTMDVYTHLTAYDERKGLAALPELPFSNKNDSERNSAVQRKTGTDDMPVKINKALTNQLTKNLYPDSNQLASFGIKRSEDNDIIQGQGANDNAMLNNTLDNERAPLSLVVSKEKQLQEGVVRNSQKRPQQPQPNH